MAPSPRKPARKTPGLAPEERADVVVTKLERFIRDHRTLSKGVSFRKWQDMARAEIAEQIHDVQGQRKADSRTLERILMVMGAGLATIGVWGTALAIGAAPDRVVAAILTMLGGLAVLWCVGALGLRSPFRRFRDDMTRDAMVRVHTVNRKVRDLEHQLKKRQKALERQIDDMPED